MSKFIKSLQSIAVVIFVMYSTIVCIVIACIGIVFAVFGADKIAMKIYKAALSTIYCVLESKFVENHVTEGYLNSWKDKFDDIWNMVESED